MEYRTLGMAYPAVGYRAGYPPQLPVAYPYNSAPQGAYPPQPPHWYGGHPPPQGAYPPPPPHWYGGHPPPQGAYPPPPPHWYGGHPPPQVAYPPPLPHWYGGYPPPPPPPPPHWYGGYPPRPAEGYCYIGHLLYGGNGYLPAAGLGQTPAGGELGSVYVVATALNAFVNLTEGLGSLLN